MHVCVCVVIVIQSGWRGMKARRRAKRRRQAAELIRRCLNDTSLLFVSVCVLGTAFCMYSKFSTLYLSFFIRFIKGFIYRHEEYCPENEYFLDHVRYSFLKNLRKNLPQNVLDKNWPTPPPSLIEVHTESHLGDWHHYTQIKVWISVKKLLVIQILYGALQASEHLQNLHMRNMVIKYCRRVQPEWKKQVRWLQKTWPYLLFK